MIWFDFIDIICMINNLFVKIDRFLHTRKHMVFFRQEHVNMKSSFHSKWDLYRALTVILCYGLTWDHCALISGNIIDDMTRTTSECCWIYMNNAHSSDVFFLLFSKFQKQSNLSSVLYWKSHPSCIWCVNLSFYCTSITSSWSWILHTLRRCL